ncbi:MAG: hypothetical protein WD469_13220 [Paenibacillaceae bacterium]
MFKNKGFLYGLGLGLILGAGLLQLMNFAVLDDKTNSNVVASLPPSISPSKKPVASIRPVETVKQAETAITPQTPSSTAVATPVIAKTGKPATPTPVATMVNPVGKLVIIENGMTSAEVANLLFSEGIIADQKAFDDALSHLKLDRIIRIGTYTFLPAEKDEDIINRITTHK